MEQFENNTKQCSCCKEIKNIQDFCKDCTRFDGLEARCKNCLSKKAAKYRNKNRLELNKKSLEYNRTHKKQRSEYNKQYYAKNKKKYQEYNKEYREKHKLEGRCVNCKNIHLDQKHIRCLECRTKINEKAKLEENKIKKRIYERNKIKIDIHYRMVKILRTRVRSALKNEKKLGSAIRDVGCTIIELKIWLENQFEEGMTWENWGNGENDWHIDHIKPLFMFDLTDRKQFLDACHYTNLRPLWKKDNLTRTYEEFNKE